MEMVGLNLTLSIDTAIYGIIKYTQSAYLRI